MEQLLKAMRAGNRSALARLISKIENRGPDVSELIKTIFPLTGKARVLGVTGPPGAGKSTLVDRLIAELRSQQRRVAVVAVDPSSPFTGGSILGDRIRMQTHVQDDGVYIRSMGTRGRLGGLARATQEVVLLLDSAGFDDVIVETVGVGQSELSILEVAQTVMVVLVPESGDSIQVMKAGIMEIADVFVVNKSDRPQADLLVKELSLWVSGMVHPAADHWSPPILKTEATLGVGISPVLDAVSSHGDYLKGLGKKSARAVHFIKSELAGILMERWNHQLELKLKGSDGKKLLEELLDRKTDPYTVADKLFSGLK